MLLTPKEWTWEDGIGFLPLKNPVPYDKAYFEKYVGYAQTEQGRIITRTRYKMVEGWVSDQVVVDIGIGSGAFLEYLRHQGWEAYGVDVNPWAIQWLLKKGWTYDASSRTQGVLTLWDVLEHIPTPDMLFSQFPAEWIFLCMPIYKDENDVFSSKHFRPGEHCWYFTQPGLMRFMAEYSYDCVEVNKKEIVLGGRESVYSFAFRRNEI